jgi:hypothetical protein
MPLWDLVFALPNLCPPQPSPFEKDGYVICAGDDPRLAELADTPANTTARAMLQEFRTHRGEAYAPGCFLIRSDIPVTARNAEGIRAFRNLCAIATTTSAFATRLHKPSGAQWQVSWSDQFQFGYFTAGHSGWVVTLGGASQGMDDAIPQQHPHPQFSNPSSWSLGIDEPLLDRLLQCWRRCYVQRKQRKTLLRLFRALEVAFHASMYPADGLTSINDIGTRLALWVSAFEVLCHSGGWVDKRRVLQVISGTPFTSKELTKRLYTVWFGKKPSQKARVTLPEAFYDDLYWARNQFLHGNVVSAATVHYRQSTGYVSLTDVAPVLFNVALVSTLGSLRIPGGPRPFGKFTVKAMSAYMKSRAGIDRAQEGLAAAGKTE